MREAVIYRSGNLAGVLTEGNSQEYVFRYDDSYFNDSSKPAISLTMPKAQQVFLSKFLFPFFYNMLSEGVNRKLQCTQLKIDETDDFGLLLATAGVDTIGAITIQAMEKA